MRYAEGPVVAGVIMQNGLAHAIAVNCSLCHYCCSEIGRPTVMAAYSDELCVDRATISRDIRYIVKWRRSFLEVARLTDESADAVIARLIEAQIHPRHGFTWTYGINCGFASVTV